MRIADLDRAVRLREIRDLVSGPDPITHIRGVGGAVRLAEPDLVRKLRLTIRDYTDEQLEQMGVVG